MFRRWTLRILFLVPVVTCSLLWPISYWRWIYITYDDSRSGRAVAVAVGGIYFVTGPSRYPERWNIGIDKSSDPLDAGQPRFLGFSIGHVMGLPLTYLRIPMWFPTTCSLALFLLIYRKTRRRNPAAAFPVQIETRKSKLEN